MGCQAQRLLDQVSVLGFASSDQSCIVAGCHSLTIQQSEINFMHRYKIICIVQCAKMRAIIGLTLALTSLSTNSECQTETSSASAIAPKSFHYISVGNVPLIGGYDDNIGLVSGSQKDNGDLSTLSDKEVREIWGINNSSPIDMDGVSWSGEPLKIRVTGTKSNEFGPLLTYESFKKIEPADSKVKFDGTAIFWTGKLNVSIEKPVSVELSPLDKKIIGLECAARGLELKHNLTNDRNAGFGTVWYLDPLDKEQREDIFDPSVEGNVLVKIAAPSRQSDAILVGCWYRSSSRQEQFPYRGPVFSYDRLHHSVFWRKAIDLDEHFTFLSINRTIYTLEFTYNDSGETFGYQISPFSFKLRRNGQSGKPEGPEIDVLLNPDEISIGRTLSWFDGE